MRFMANASKRAAPKPTSAAPDPLFMHWPQFRCSGPMDVSTLLMLAICVAVGGLPGTMGWVPATTGVGGKLIWSAYDKPLFGRLRLADSRRRHPLLSAPILQSAPGMARRITMLANAHTEGSDVDMQINEKPQHPDACVVAADASYGHREARPGTFADASGSKRRRRRKSRQQRTEGEAAAVRLPPALKAYRNLTEIIEALRPSVAAAARGDLNGASAAIAMNHLKRLACSPDAQGREVGGSDAALQDDVSDFLCVYARCVIKEADSLTAKHLSLAVNALAANYPHSPAAVAAKRAAMQSLLAPLGSRFAVSLQEAKREGERVMGGGGIQGSSKNASTGGALAQTPTEQDWEFPVRSIALILNGYVRAGFATEEARKRKQVRELLQGVVELAKADARRWQQRKMVSAEYKRADRKAREAQGDAEANRGQSWALLLNALAGFEVRDRELIVWATREIVTAPRSALTAHDIANVVHALDRLDTWPEGLNSWAADVVAGIPVARFSIREITAIWGTASVRLEGLHQQMRAKKDRDRRGVGNMSVSVQDAEGAQRLCTRMAECVMRLPAREWTPRGAALVMNALSRGIVADMPVSAPVLRATMARVSEVMRCESQMLALLPHEASLTMNALARASYCDVPLLVRLADALLRAPRSSWSAQDIVRVTDAMVRLQLSEVAALRDLDLASRLQEELLAMPAGALGARGLASIAYAANNFTDLDNQPFWARIVAEAHAVDPASYAEGSISLLASVLTRPTASAAKSSAAAASSLAASSPDQDAGLEPEPSIFCDGREVAGRCLDDDVARQLYQHLLCVLQAASPRALRWETLGFLVAAERRHRRSGQWRALTPDSSIESAVEAALQSFQGAGLLSIVAQALKDSPPPAAGYPERALVGLVVRLATAMAYAPRGVLSAEDRREVFQQLRCRILELPPKVLGVDDMTALVRALLHGGPREAEGGGALDGELMRRFARETKEHLNRFAPGHPDRVTPRQAIALLSALGGRGGRGGVRLVVGEGMGTGAKYNDALMSLVRVLSKYTRAMPAATLEPGELAELLAAFAAMRLRDGALFRYAAANILAYPSSAFSAWDVSTIVNAYSRVGVWDEAVCTLALGLHARMHLLVHVHIHMHVHVGVQTHVVGGKAVAAHLGARGCHHLRGVFVRGDAHWQSHARWRALPPRLAQSSPPLARRRRRGRQGRRRGGAAAQSVPSRSGDREDAVGGAQRLCSLQRVG